jgi:hypothetical protein
LADLRSGYLLNFELAHFKTGIKRSSPVKTFHRDLRGHRARILPMFSPVRIGRIGKDILPIFGQPGAKKKPQRLALS